MRKANGNIYAPKETVQKPDYLGVKLASDSGSRSPASDVDRNITRRSKASIDMLHNPFGGDEEEELEEPDEDDLEVTLFYFA